MRLKPQPHLPLARGDEPRSGERGGGLFGRDNGWRHPDTPPLPNAGGKRG